MSSPNLSSSPSKLEWDALHRAMDKLDSERLQRQAPIDVQWVKDTIRKTYEVQGIEVNAGDIARVVDGSSLMGVDVTQTAQAPRSAWGQAGAWLRTKTQPLMARFSPTPSTSIPTLMDEAKSKVMELAARGLHTDDDLKALLEAQVPRHKKRAWASLPMGVAAFLSIPAGPMLIGKVIFPFITDSGTGFFLAISAVFLCGLSVWGSFAMGFAFMNHYSTNKTLIKEFQKALSSLVRGDNKAPALLKSLRRLGLVDDNCPSVDALTGDSFQQWAVAGRVIRETPELAPIWQAWLESPKPIRESDVHELKQVGDLVARAQAVARKQQQATAEGQREQRMRALKEISDQSGQSKLATRAVWYQITKST